MPHVEIYTRPFCPYCTRARQLLDRYGIEFLETDIRSDPAEADLARKRSGRTSVPQIFIDGHHVGGSDDLAAAAASGLLARLVDRTA